MQNCDNSAIDSRLFEKREERGPQLLSLTRLCSKLISFLDECACCLKVCPNLFLLLLALKRQAGSGKLCLDLLIRRHFFLHQREPKGERGLVLGTWGTVPSSSAHHSGRRCSRLGVRWYLMWRGPVSFPDILSWVHCCKAPILHCSQSRSHQMALKSEAEREREHMASRKNKDSEGQSKKGWREGEMWDGEEKSLTANEREKKLKWEQEMWRECTLRWQASKGQEMEAYREKMEGEKGRIPL